MEKFGFSLQERYRVPMGRVVELLAEAGFRAVSPGWQRYGDWTEAVCRAKELGLTVQSLHGPLRGMPAMWSRDPGPIREDLLRSAEDCARAEIPVLVVHPWNGVDYVFRPQDLCFDHFDALVGRARDLGIRIAFENLEGREYLAALMDRYRGCDAVGFCWDSGHEKCYTPHWDPLALYGDRLVMTHLNDNQGVTDPGGRLQGTDDLHLLPGHGLLDWPDTLRRLRAAAPQGILNWELKLRPKGDRCRLDLYSTMPLEDYFREAYQRAREAMGRYFEEVL